MPSPSARVSPQDPVAALVASVVALLGASSLVSRLGLTADDVALLGGLVLAIAATVRVYLARRAGEAAGVPTAAEMAIFRELLERGLAAQERVRELLEHNRQAVPERPISTLDVRGPEDTTRRLTEGADA